MSEYNTTSTFKSNLLTGKINNLDPSSGDSTFPTTTAILQPRKSSFSSTALGTTEKVYNGNQTDIAAIALWAANKYYSYTVQELPNQLFQIAITLPYDEITAVDDLVTELVQWEITENIVNRDLFDAGIFTTNNAGVLDITTRYTVPPFVAIMIKNAIKATSNNGQFNFNQAALSSTNFTTNQKTQIAKLINISNQFFYLLKSGITSVKTATQHVKRVGVYSLLDQAAYDNNPYYQSIAMDQTGTTLSTNLNIYGNPNCIISTTDLINIFSVDAVTAKQLEPSYTRMKTSTTLGDPITIFAQAGWLMHSPIRTFLTPTKVRVEQLFEFDEWVDTVYGRVSPISHFPLINSTPYPNGFSWPNS